MSYDLRLYQKDGSKKPLSNAFLTSRLHEPEYSLEILKNGFNVSGKDEDGHFTDPYAYQGEDKGFYWTYCSYNVNSDVFEIFKKRACRVAKKLDLLIQDPQLETDELFMPEDYFNNHECTKRFLSIKSSTKQVVEKIIGTEINTPPKSATSPWLTELSTSERFIQYYLISEDPTTNQLVYLSPGENLICAGKLNINKSLEDTIREYVFECTGSTQYEIVKIIKNNDFAKKRTGETLPRDAVYIKVSHFEPKNNFNQENFKWLPF